MRILSPFTNSGYRYRFFGANPPTNGSYARNPSQNAQSHEVFRQHFMRSRVISAARVSITATTMACQRAYLDRAGFLESNFDIFRVDVFLNTKNNGG